MSKICPRYVYERIRLLGYLPYKSKERGLCSRDVGGNRQNILQAKEAKVSWKITCNGGNLNDHTQQTYQQEPEVCPFWYRAQHYPCLKSITCFLTVPVCYGDCVVRSSFFGGVLFWMWSWSGDLYKNSLKYWQNSSIYNFYYYLCLIDVGKKVKYLQHCLAPNN